MELVWSGLTDDLGHLYAPALVDPDGVERNLLSLHYRRREMDREEYTGGFRPVWEIHQTDVGLVVYHFPRRRSIDFGSVMKGTQATLELPGWSLKPQG